MKAKYLVYIAFVSFLVSCKREWLEAKPQLSLVVPSTISDYQALLERTDQGFNDRGNVSDELGSDDYYVTDASYSTGTVLNRNAYIWAADLFEGGEEYIEWRFPYELILKANIVLDGIDKILPKNNAEQLEWNQAKGSALFFRAYRHYDVAKLFCKPFIENSAATDPGIPLRLSSDFNVASKRSSVKSTYAQIVGDLKAAEALLPIGTPINDIYRCRPNKAAAQAMLARVYLSMNKFDSAYYYSNQCLQSYNRLIDYNGSDGFVNPAAATVKIARFNPEVIFHVRANNFTFLAASRLIVDQALFDSYDANDARKTIFFRNVSGSLRFLGSYDNSLTFFSGLATDEMYLIRAESSARSGNKDAALNDLNTLMIKRWKNNGTWVPFTATTSEEALKIILIERRKELCFRGLRWSDLRRLNQDSKFAVTLTRTVNTKSYTLPANDKRYVFPIPADVIQLAGIEQNPR